MMLKKQEIGTLFLSLLLLSVLCLFFNKLSHGSFFYQDKQKRDAPSFVEEEIAIKEEKKQQSKKVEVINATSTVKVPIFVYHSVRPHIQGESALQDAYDVTPELFEEQLRYLKDNKYEVITMDELDGLLQHGIVKGDTKKRVILSFDDGWENQYTYAFPLLKKYSMTAIFYVYTQPLGYKHFLSWEQIKTMHDEHMEIGSHTITHPFFKKTSDESMRHEIADSKKEIEKAGYHTGRTIFRGLLQSDTYALRGNLVTDSMQDFIDVLEGHDHYR
jgi:hypothetical protein